MSGLRRVLGSVTDKVPGGRKALGARRRVKFARKIRSSGLFDTAWYELQRGEEFDGERAALEDYLTHGADAGLSPTPLFEPEWYAPKKRKSGPDRLWMYLSRPRHMLRRSPHLLFDPSVYRKAHEESTTHRAGPLGHFMEHAGPATELDLAHLLGVPGASAPWSRVRECLEAATVNWRAQERLRTAPRRVFRYDHGHQERFVARLAPLRDPVAAADGQGPRPVVSIILPVWNRSAQLRRAVESVKAQTLTDWELIVVDDGSTDDSPLVMQGLATFDDRIKVTRQDRSGVSRARNRGIAAARGDYVAFLDSDNTWTDGFLRTALRAMDRDGLRAAYTAMELHGDEGAVSYRAFDGGREHLLIGNHIDLNVLVVRTDLLREVGGFAEDLRRAVDFDLVLRLSERSPLTYLPYIGAIYTEDGDDTTRISVAEPLTWDYVVRSRHSIDWAAADAAPRTPGRLSVVVPVRDDVRAARRCVAEVLRQPEGEEPLDLEVVVLDIASRRSASVQLAGLGLTDPRVRVKRVAVDVKYALAFDTALAETTGEFVAVAGPRTAARPGWARPLLAALRQDGVAAVQPLVTGPDGAVLGAGATFTAAPGLPSRLLAGMPVEDVFTLGAEVDVPALAGPVWAARAADLLQVRGLDCLFAQEWHETDLALRLRDKGRCVLVTTSVFDELEGSIPDPDPVPTRDDELFLKRWRGVKVEPGDGLWRRAGLEIAHHRTERDDELGRRRAVPVLVRRPQLVVPERLAPGAVAPGTPCLRWALKVAAPAGPRGRTWGDWHFAQSLAEALRRLGQEVVVDVRQAAYRSTGYLDDVNLVLRGLDHVEPDPSRVNLMWVISHPDLVTPEELSGYDRVFAASGSWARKISLEWSQPVTPLLQCTDASRFVPEAAEPDSGPAVLFVGNSRRVFRPVVQYAQEASRPLTVYGGGWEPFLPEKVIAGVSLRNEEVPAAYASAGVVLNDHWDDMRLGGFISNRVFDVLAVGGRLLTDRVDGLEEFFPGAARTWAHGVELVEILDTPVAEAFPSRESRLATAAVVAAEHSFDARARQLLDAALAVD